MSFIRKKNIKVIQEKLKNIQSIDVHVLMIWLEYSMMIRHFDISKILLDAGIDPNVQDASGETVLHYRCRHSFTTRLDLILLLLEYGANPMLRDNFGNTPFDYACRNNASLDVLKVLMYAGAWFNPDLSYAQTSEIWALKKSKRDCILALRAFNFVMRNEVGASKDITHLIIFAVWNKRFDFICTFREDLEDLGK